MAVLCAFFLIACYFDYSQRRIPNLLLIFVLIHGLFYRIGQGGCFGLGVFAGQVLSVFVLLYFFFRIGGLGAGDVKLLALTSGYLRFESVLVFLFLSLLFSAALSVFLLFRERQLGARLRSLANYVEECFLVGEFRGYPVESKGKRLAVCMSGPAFLSLLLYVGGVY